MVLLRRNSPAHLGRVVGKILVHWHHLFKRAGSNMLFFSISSARYGFVAQELEEIMPELVRNHKDNGCGMPRHGHAL